jgi:hypothetical protein
MPISFIFTEMDSKEIEGYAMTIMPRAGKVLIYKEWVFLHYLLAVVIYKQISP